MTTPTSPLQEQVAAAQELIGQAGALWVAAAEQSDSADGPRHRRPNSIGARSRRSVGEGLCRMAGSLHQGRRFLTWYTPQATEPLPSECHRRAPRQHTLRGRSRPSARSCESACRRSPFPAAGIVFSPPFLPAGITQFRIVLKDYRFIGANYTGKIKLTTAATATNLAPQDLVSGREGGHRRIVSDKEAYASSDELLDRAVRAINLGDRKTADALAGQVLAVDGGNPDAEELLAAPGDSGEIRRLSILFADLVDSTALVDQSRDRGLPHRRRAVSRRGKPNRKRLRRPHRVHPGRRSAGGVRPSRGPRERRAPRRLRRTRHHQRDQRAQRACATRFGFDISVRVGIHRGLVYLDTAQDDVYGLGANLAARVCSIAAAGNRRRFRAHRTGGARHVRTRGDRAADGQGRGRPDPHLPRHRRTRRRNHARADRSSAVSANSRYLQRSWATGRRRAPCRRRESHFKARAESAKPGWPMPPSTWPSRTAPSCSVSSGRRFTPMSGSARYGGCWNAGAASNATPIRPIGFASWRPRSSSARWTRPPWSRCWPPCWASAPRAATNPAGPSGAKLYGQIVGAIHDYLLACLGSGPGLVLVDDVHWFDEDTIEVVQTLLRERQRPADRRDHRTHASAACPTPTAVFEVKPLSDADTDKLVLALHPELDSEARSAVHKRCDGIPLYIEEVVAKLKEQPSGCQPNRAGARHPLRIPFREAAIREEHASGRRGCRADRQPLRSCAAVLGGRLGQARNRRSAQGADTTSACSQPTDAGSWRFHHELLREVAAELSPPTVRRRLHSRIADALVGASADANPEWPLVAQSLRTS